MNKSDVRPEVAPATETLSGPKKIAVLVALGGVFGFALGYLVKKLREMRPRIVETNGCHTTSWIDLSIRPVYQKLAGIAIKIVLGVPGPTRDASRT